MQDFITTNVSPVGGGQIVRVKNDTQLVDAGSDYVWRYYWNLGKLDAVAAQGYVFDHWTCEVTEIWYEGTSTQGQRGPELFRNVTTYTYYDQSLEFTVDEGSYWPSLNGRSRSDGPGYIEGDTYTTSTSPIYYYPWLEHYWIITAYFKRIQPQYTHLPVYNPANNTLMRHLGPNLLLRDSP